jgi:hypothetical protein
MSVDLDNLSLAELKKQAKGRGIKQYYIMKKDDLLALLKLPEIPFKYRIEKMTIIELREMAKMRGLHGFWGLSKSDLTRLLFPDENTINHTSSDQHKKDDGKTGEHENPEKKDAQNIRIELSENTDH